MRHETIILNEERNVTLTAYIQEAEGEFLFSKRPAMLVLPGGGYSMCSDREADPVALAYMRAGYQAFILRYSTGRHKAWPHPLEDYEQAMALIESRAGEWHLDAGRINAVGFSAGGHLCACAATIAAHKPAAAILVYPVILKDICDLCQPGMPQPHEHVTAGTSPCFFAACRDDRTVDVKNTLMMQLALAERGIAFESHIYSFGGHGFSTGESWIAPSSVSSRVPDWVGDSVGWLKELQGTLTSRGFGEPVIEPNLHADFAPALSAACSLNHLCGQSDDVKAVLKPLFDGIQAAAGERGCSVESVIAAVGNHPARELMERARLDPDVIRSIDRALRGMSNQRGEHNASRSEK